MKTTMGVIPGGCTKFLQPLDVLINKPFKSFFHEYYDEWYRKGDFEYTKGGIINGWLNHGKRSRKILSSSHLTLVESLSDPDKIHCLSADQPTDEARVLLNDRNEGLECVPNATLHDSDYDNVDTVRIEDETNLTEQIIQDELIEISAI